MAKEKSTGSADGPARHPVLDLQQELADAVRKSHVDFAQIADSMQPADQEETGTVAQLSDIGLDLDELPPFPALAYVTISLAPSAPGFGSFAWTEGGDDAFGIYTTIDNKIYYRRLTCKGIKPGQPRTDGIRVHYYLFWDDEEETPYTLAWAFQVEPSPDGSYTIYCGKLAGGDLVSQRALRIPLGS